MNYKRYFENPLNIGVSLMVQTRKLWPLKWYIATLYLLKFRKRISFKNPITFSEKLNWTKVYDRNPEYWKYVNAKERGDGYCFTNNWSQQ